MTVSLSAAELMFVEERVAYDAPTTGLAYVLWFCLGLFSAHRFYMGRPGSAVLQILSYFIVVGFVWWIADAFMIPRMVEERKDRLRGRIVKQLTSPAGRRELLSRR